MGLLEKLLKVKIQLRPPADLIMHNELKDLQRPFLTLKCDLNLNNLKKLEIHFCSILVSIVVVQLVEGNTCLSNFFKHVA